MRRQGPAGRWTRGRDQPPKAHPPTPVSPGTTSTTATHLTAYLTAASALNSREAALESDTAKRALGFLRKHPIDDRFGLPYLWMDPLIDGAYVVQAKFLIKAQAPDGSWAAVRYAPWPMRNTTNAIVVLSRKPR